MAKNGLNNILGGHRGGIFFCQFYMLYSIWNNILHLIFRFREQKSPVHQSGNFSIFKSTDRSVKSRTWKTIQHHFPKFAPIELNWLLIDSQNISCQLLTFVGNSNNHLSAPSIFCRVYYASREIRHSWCNHTSSPQVRVWEVNQCGPFGDGKWVKSLIDWFPNIFYVFDHYQNINSLLTND